MIPEAALGALAELVKVGISVIDLVDPDDPETWVIAFNNAAASEASQFDVVPLRGQRFLEAFPQIRDTPFVNWYREVLRSGAEREIPEIRYGDENVPDAAFRVWLTPLADRLVLGQYLNVTLQRRAEGRLRELNRRLERLVEQRTEGLRESHRMLREVALATAHDLQPPVVQVLRLASLLEPQLTTDAAAADLANLVGAAWKAKHRLDSLLRYTHVPGPDEPDERIDLEGLIADVLGELDDADEAELTVDVRVSEIVGHRGRIRHLVHELLDNALRFHAPASRRAVSVKVVTGGGGVQLVIADNGIGIPADRHDDVFSAFRRLHPSNRYPGIGMGLTVARSIARSAGGDIALSSTVGEGTEVVVTLPERPLERAVP